jgi:hypothetical protein
MLVQHPMQLEHQTYLTTRRDEPLRPPCEQAISPSQESIVTKRFEKRLQLLEEWLVEGGTRPIPTSAFQLLPKMICRYQ